MNTPAQKRAVERYRARLAQRGIARFEVAAPESDRELIKALARRLAEDGPDAKTIRAAVRSAIDPAPRIGGIVEALRRSPLIETSIDLNREHADRRAIEL